ncbi:MAG: FAD-binding oxidoreductase [Rhodobacteraceae bacterium]|nr:FAD-binding oxidoreductase [Paracoccaceae bacterium]
MDLLTANDRTGDYPPTFYSSRLDLPARRPALAGEVRADVAIVGAGYTGLSAALHLALAGARVVVVEAARAGFGASGRNGGQVSSGQRVEVDELEARHGPEAARALWDLGEQAKSLVRTLIARHDIVCDWRDGVLHAECHARNVPSAHRLAERLATRYGYDRLEPLDHASLRDIVPSPRLHGGVLDHGAGHLDPLAYALGLARAAEGAGAVIHEGSRVNEIEESDREVILRTDGGRLRADQVILAANGYLGGLEPRVAARVMPINNFIVATAPLGPRASEVLRRDVAVSDSRFVVNYFRLSQDGRLLFGGGETYGYRFPGDIAGLVRKPMTRIFPQLADVEITHAWGGTLAITMSRMPHVARLGPRIASASGYSGHGIALATLAGRLLAEAARGPSEGFDLLSRLPHRRFPGGPALRSPLLVLAMSWYALRDRLGL